MKFTNGKWKGVAYMTNTEKLKHKIEQSGVTMVHLAAAIGVTRECFYKKLMGKTEFKASEIVALTKALHLTNSEREDIFFAA